MRIIDSHVHLYPPELNAAPAAWAAARGEAHWSVLCTRRRRDGRAVQGFPSVTELLQELDRAGIERAVLQGWYWQQPANCTWQNRFYAECRRAHPDRFEAFATVHAGAGRQAVLEEMQRAHEAGFVGLGELSPHSQGYTVDDPVWQEALQRAGELGLVVNLHVTDPASRPYPGRVETPLADFTRLAVTFRATRFVLAHWGGLLPLVEGAGDKRPPANLWYDTAASPLLYGPEIWSRMAEVKDRVLFGSDFPLDLYPRAATAEGGLRQFVAEARTAGADAGVLAENFERLIRRR